MITEEKLDMLIKDEFDAQVEYAQMIHIDPQFRVLSDQEGRHHAFLVKLKKRLQREGKL